MHGRGWMYSQFRVSASLLAVEDLKTQPEIGKNECGLKMLGFIVQQGVFASLLMVGSTLQNRSLQ